MRGVLVLAALFGCALLTAGAAAWGQELAQRWVAIEDCEGGWNSWHTWAGDSPPLPKGGMEIVVDDAEAGNRCGSFFYDVSCDRGYVSSDLDRLFPPRVQAVRFRLRNTGAVRFTVRVVDDSGQTHQMDLPQEPEPWRWIVLKLDRPWSHHFQGKDDGQFHQPLTSLKFLLLAGSDPKVGTILIDDIEVLTDATDQELAECQWIVQKLRFETTALGSLFYPTDRVQITLAASPPADPNTVLCFKADLLDAHDTKVADLPEVTLDQANGFAATVPLPDALGYYRLAGTLTDGVRTKPFETRYAVIPVNPHLDDKDEASPFGVNTHFNQGWNPRIAELVKRAGIAWIRDGEARPDDPALKVAKANHLAYMPCFTAWRSRPVELLQERLKQGVTGEALWDFSEAAAWHAQFAKEAGDYVDYYDLMNEPHGHWSAAFGGGWYGGEWLTYFAKFGAAVSQAIKQADPGAKIVWEDVDQLLWYRDFIQLGAAEYIDAISPHTYNLHRNLSLPEEQPSLAQYDEYFRFTRQHNLDWPVWIGEVGFSSFELTEKSAPFYTPHTEPEQANMLVRMMTLHLNAGAAKIFWYDFKNDGWENHNCEHNFGLVRDDLLPKPALVAYANYIARFRHGRWLGRYAIGGGGDAFAFSHENSGNISLIAWTRRDQKTEALPVFSSVNEVTLTDLYGRTATAPVTDGRVILDLTESPIYIDGLTKDDILPR